MKLPEWIPQWVKDIDWNSLKDWRSQKSWMSLTQWTGKAGTNFKSAIDQRKNWVREAQKNSKKSTKAKKQMQFMFAGGTLVVVIITVIALSFLLADNSPPKDDARQADTPLELAPDLKESGVTVLAKQMPAETVRAQPIYAPTAQGAQKAEGFAIELGSALSYAELSARFAQIVRLNNNISAFDRLDPRAILTDTLTGLEARLLVGPFETQEDAQTACQAIRRPDNLECKATQFDGELIERQ